jgi:hypothetical protein
MPRNDVRRKAWMGLAALLMAAVVGSIVAEGSDQTKVVRPRAGAAGQWRLIGQVTANFKADHDTIVVRGPYDNFRRIKFKVTDAPVNIKLLVVTYDNGAPDRLEVRERIPKNGESRAIDLRGVGQRSLRKIEVWYDTAGVLRGRADVTLFGMK